MLLTIWKNKGKSCLFFSKLNGLVQKRLFITWPRTWALFLPPTPTAPWMLFHLLVLWSIHNRCFVGVFMLNAERKNGIFVTHW